MVGTSTKALLKGIDTWKKETMMKVRFGMLRLLVCELDLMDFFVHFLYHFLTDVIEYFETELLFQEAANVLESESKQGDGSLIRKAHNLLNLAQILMKSKGRA